jgi:hypothetical protein
MRLSESPLDLQVLAFALGLSLLAALLFGLAPALERARGEGMAALRVAEPGGSGFVRLWCRCSSPSLWLS